MQIRASVAFGGRSLSQYSQFGLSSSATRASADFGARKIPTHDRRAQCAPRPLQNRVDPFGALARRRRARRDDGQSRRPDPSRRRDARRATLDEPSAGSSASAHSKGGGARCGARAIPNFSFSTSRRRSPPAIARVSSAGARRRKAFLAAFPGGPRGADAMDEVLHASGSTADASASGERAARIAAGRSDDRAGRPRLRSARGGKRAPWSFAGYGAPESCRAGRRGRRLDAAIDGRGARGRLSAAMGRHGRA